MFRFAGHDRRQVLVTQANWVHHRVTLDQPVIDVSATNNWSSVRVWWPPAGEMGVSDYPAYGFIRTGPATRDQIVAATPRAIRLAGRTNDGAVKRGRQAASSRRSRTLT
jgi:hypothetical protein